jgi:hypothetical protein
METGVFEMMPINNDYAIKVNFSTSCLKLSTIYSIQRGAPHQSKSCSLLISAQAAPNITNTNALQYRPYITLRYTNMGSRYVVTVSLTRHFCDSAYSTRLDVHLLQIDTEIMTPIYRLISFIFNVVGWGETESTWYVGHYLAYCTSPGWRMSMEHLVEWELAGETEVLGKTCSSATLSTTNPTRPDLESNPGRRGGKPATTRLSYGTALWYIDSHILFYL